MCARFVGDNNKVLTLFESGTYSSASGTGQWIGLVNNHSQTDNTNVQNIRYIGGADRNVNVFVDGPIDHEGTLTFHPQDWKMLGYALGSVVDTGSPSPYQHNLEESNSGEGNAFTSGALAPFSSFTIEDSKTDPVGTGTNFIRTSKGCVVNSWTLSASQGDILSCEVNYIAQDRVYSSGVTTAVTASTTRPFLWQDIKIHLPSGTVINELKDFSLSVNNNLEASHYQNGSRQISNPLPLNRDNELSITIDGTSQKSKEYYDKYYRGGSEFNMLFEATDASAGAGSRSLFYSLSGCKMTEMDDPSTMEGSQEQSMTITPKNTSAVVQDGIELYNIF